MVASMTGAHYARSMSQVCDRPSQKESEFFSLLETSSRIFKRLSAAILRRRSGVLSLRARRH